MGDRRVVVVGILAMAAIVAWLLLRSGDKSAPTEPKRTGSGALTTGPKASSPEAPSLPSQPSGPALPELPPAPTADDTFSEESRDAGWATKTEAELQKRWKNVRGGKLQTVECHTSYCKLVISGPEQDLAMTISDLEGPRGLHGFAENVLLTAPSTNADNTITLRVYARFDRK